MTQPFKVGFGKKTPEVLEIKVGGSDINAVLAHAKDLLGKEVRAKDLFSERHVHRRHWRDQRQGVRGCREAFRRQGPAELAQAQERQEGRRRNQPLGPPHDVPDTEAREDGLPPEDGVQQAYPKGRG